MAGNAVVLKHALNVPGCALAIEAIFEDAGFPSNLFRTLMIESPQVQAVIEHPLVGGHAFDTQVETHVTTRFSPAELIMSRLADNSSDVMGAYGHSRLRETILGGMTRVTAPCRSDAGR
jgi:hypothetical protein